ncbi:YbaB/EbfC family nucleoid-associated protein [Lentzea jiangxiensis]|uniref:YbaB/EbfC DNA-binding family protein n=1 Tax=Lentzea jiangxiensis TaxID=641025 RepID=A0A1H0J7W8_9PSEU|nr:YbaB/EbfC family nucleoid-associated protein [Lentzea jiangxiensis]SDO39817.1 hypothetical protein SAMN05421507_102403 [Lentzea jiangxiensis]
MTDPGSLAGQAGQLVEQASFLSDRARRRLEALRSTRESALASTGEASTPDGSVRATVDAGGMLTALVLTPAALQQNPRRLAAAVLQVAQQAASSARAGVRQAYTRLENEGLVKHMPLLLPEVSVAPPAPAPAPVRRRPVEEDEEFGGPVMKDQGW